MNIKKLFSVAAVVTFLGSTFLPGLALAATPDTELGKAYEWAYANGITTKDTYEAANMTAPITRAEMAKMLSNYAKKFQEKTPDTSATCNFNDTASVGGDLAVAIVESCQLGIMGQGINAFRPYDTITRAEFGTALSRVLWDKTYEGGTPYYAGHLNALKAAGIMTVIANAESMKEVRGYVMLMLMRSENETPSICEETDVKVICAVEEAAEEYKDCPAACRKDNTKEDEKEDTVVKSGDLEISLNSNKWADAFLYGGISDLDTLTFKASEEGINVTKVTLERYGYSSTDDVDVVWLENKDGTRITDPKELNSKDQVTLSILKDYRTLEDGDTMTVVLQTYDGKLPDGNNDDDYKAGSSIGFKVTNIETSAANLDASDIKGNPYLYDLVSYNGSDVVLTYKGKNDTYHIGEGPYEVFRFKLKASSTSAASVRGFTVTNVAAENKLDLEDFVDELTVTVNDEKVKNVTYTIDDDEITVNFDEVEVGIKETAIFTMYIDLSDDFDKLESKVLFVIDESSDLKVTEKKTGARVSVSGLVDEHDAKIIPDALYSFNGSKLTLSNTKLGTVNMAAGSDDVAIAEWSIELWGQSLVIAADTITVTAKNEAAEHAAKWTKWAGIEAMRLVVAGEEFDAKCTDNADFTTTCVFNKKITIEKEGKLQIVVDIDDEDYLKDTTINFKVNDGWSLLSKTTITTIGVAPAPIYVKGLTYEDSKAKVLASDFVGSVTLEKLKITAAKASLDNDLNKAVEFKKNETTTNTVFEGTYTAKKQDLTLTDVYYKPSVALSNADDSVTFNLYVDGKLVASTDITKTDGTKEINDTLTRTNIKAGESVKVKIEAEAYVAADYATPYVYNVKLVGEDSDWNTAGQADADTVDMKFVAAGSVDVEAITNSNYKQKDVLLRASNLPIAAFRVSGSNGKVDLDKLVFDLTSGEAVPAHCANGTTETQEVCKADKFTKTTVTTTVEENQATCEASAANANPLVTCEKIDEGNYTKTTVTTAVEENQATCEASAANDNPLVTCEQTHAASTWVDEVPVAKVAASKIRVKVNGENIDSDNITGEGTITVDEIDEKDIDENGVEVIISFKNAAEPGAYTLNLTKVNTDTKGIVFKKNIVPALLTIEQKDLNGSTQFKFSVEKYDSSNTVSDVHFYKGGVELGEWVTTDVSNGTTFEVEGDKSTQLVDEIVYQVNGYGEVRIKKSDYNDYFKVGDTYLKVFKAD